MQWSNKRLFVGLCAGALVGMAVVVLVELFDLGHDIGYFPGLVAIAIGLAGLVVGPFRPDGAIGIGLGAGLGGTVAGLIFVVLEDVSMTALLGGVLFGLIFTWGAGLGIGLAFIFRGLILAGRYLFNRLARCRIGRRG